MKKATYFVALASLQSVVALAAAPVGYDGPAVDVNFVNQKPAKYAECDQYSNLPTARVYAACEFARDEAERMAVRFGGGHGRVDGFLRGYSWGLYKATRAWRNNADEMARGAKLVDGMGDKIASGLQEGINAGTSQGQSQGKTDAINRFKAVMDTGREPDPTLRVNVPAYEGMDGAYVKLVGPIPSEQDIIRNELQPAQLPITSDWDQVYLGEPPSYSVWDFWFDNGTYEFEHDSWFKADRALDTWFKRPIDTRPKYDNLNNPPVTNPDGTPMIDPATGQPYNLQAIFAKSFMNSYGWYINYNYSSTFYLNLDQGQVMGEIVGEQLGKRIASYVGLERAFDQKFKESAKSTFSDAYSTAYTSLFSDTFRYYQNTAILSLHFDSIEGREKDGIIQAGERVDAKFTVLNEGGKASELRISMSGDVADVKSSTQNIGRLMTGRFTAPDIAAMRSTLKNGEVADIVLHVNDQASDLRQKIQKMIEVDNVSARLEVLNGTGAVHVTITNVATVTSPGSVGVSLLLNGKEVDTQLVEPIPGGDSRDVVLGFQGIDPMVLIEGGMDAKIVVKMNNAVMDDRAELQLKSGDAQNDLAKYYNQLVNGKTDKTGNEDVQTRTAEVASRVVGINLDETHDLRSVSGRNPWASGSTETMLGKIVALFHGSVQSNDAKNAYDSLGRAMWDARKNLKKFLFWAGPKRKSYEAAVQSIVKSKLK